jgi:hypothetical protein
LSDLLKINVNEHTERKNGLTYLSWAWAWAEVLKIDPRATWSVKDWGGDGPAEVPCFALPDGSMLVGVHVTVKEHSKTCLLPVMDHRNKAIKNPDAFAVNTAIMRCLAKAIAMHGLGLYIYAGEDLPEGEDAKEERPTPKGSGATGQEIGASALAGLDEDRQRFVRQVAANVTAKMPDGSAALEILEFAGFENEERVALWGLLDSATRSAIKKASSATSEQASA